MRHVKGWMDVAYKLWESVLQYLNKFIYMLPKLTLGIIVILIFSFIAVRLSRLVQKGLKRRMRDSLLVDFIARLLRWAMILVGLILALEVAGFSGAAGSLVAGAGITAFIIGFAFKDIGENFLAGFILAFKRPFEIGDVIQSKDIKGKVVTLDLRTTHLKKADGVDVYMPNSALIKEALHNYTRDGHERYSTDIEVKADLSLSEVKEKIISSLGTLPGIDKEKAPSVTVEQIKGDKMTLRIYYWIDHFAYQGDENLLKGEAVQRIGNLLQSMK